MNLKLDPIGFVKWMHFLAVSIGGGAAVVALLLSGFEEGKEDLQGLAATVWAKVVAWSFRLALVAGIALFVLMLKGGHNPLNPAEGFYFHIKLTLVFVLVGLSEMTPKALAAGKRGSALLVLVLFLAVGFTVFNKGLFRKDAPRSVPEPVAAATSFTAR